MKEIENTLTTQHSKLDDVLTGLNQAYEKETAQREKLVQDTSALIQKLVTATNEQVKTIKEILTLEHMIQYQIQKN